MSRMQDAAMNVGAEKQQAQAQVYGSTSAPNEINATHYLAETLSHMAIKLAEGSDERHALTQAAHSLRENDARARRFQHAADVADQVIAGLRRRIDMAQFALTAQVPIE